MSCYDLLWSGRRSAAKSEKASIHSSSPLIEKVDAETDEHSEFIDTTDRIVHLRKLMTEEGVQVYIVPSEDEHSTEMISSADERRRFISGFTGSTGVAIITSQEAHLFTDGRYWIQAEKQLDSNWTLHKVPLVKNWDQWLIGESIKQGGLTIGVDPKLVKFTQARTLLLVIMQTEGSFVFPSRNLVDVVWGSARPTLPKALVRVHPLEYAGQSSTEKLSKMAAWLASGGDQASIGGAFPQGSSYCVTELDQIAWLLNLRGASFPCSPIFPSYLVVKPEGSSYSARLFISADLLSSTSEAYKYLIEELKIQVQGYHDIWEYLISGEWTDNTAAKRLICGENVSWAVVDLVGIPNSHILQQSPLSFWKAVKNEVEVEGMKRAYLRDGVCWAKWAAWLEEAIRMKKETIDEKEAADALVALRQKADKYAGMEAYDAISASGENAALPHYETPEKGSRIIDQKTPYLMDSGGQYFDGTIDTTRTVHFGKPTAEQRRAYTRVLQGHIAIETTIFPKNSTTGATLDVIARRALWKEGMNYAHGTGHGIGSFLNVHEGPQGFSFSSGGSLVPAILEENMCMSNEPGFYEEGNYGIRIESILRVTSVQTRRGFNGKDNWLGFERLTVVPIDKNLVNYKLLSKEEAKWLQCHNEWCKERLKPLLKDDKRALKWLKKQ